MREFEDLVARFERFQAGVRTAEDPRTRYDGMGHEVAVHLESP